MTPISDALSAVLDPESVDKAMAALKGLAMTDGDMWTLTLAHDADGTELVIWPYPVLGSGVYTMHAPGTGPFTKENA